MNVNISNFEMNSNFNISMSYITTEISKLNTFHFYMIWNKD